MLIIVLQDTKKLNKVKYFKALRLIPSLTELVTSKLD